MTAKIRKAILAAQNICGETRDLIAKLDRLAQTHGEIRATVDELKSKLEYIDEVCNVGMILDGQTPQG